MVYIDVKFPCGLHIIMKSIWYNPINDSSKIRCPFHGKDCLNELKKSSQIKNKQED